MELSGQDSILEIGPGRGELTRLLTKEAKFVYAVEVDRELSNSLKEEFAQNPKIKIIHRDILRFALDKELPVAKLKVFGNIPYYITTPIIEHLLKYRRVIQDIFITVQKEFGERLSASPGSKAYGSFSCFLQYYCSPKVLFNIRKNSFWPAPKVDSCFLKLTLRKNPAVKVKDPDALFALIRQAFSQRRKTLRNSLQGTIAEERLEGYFKRYNIDRNIRPESLGLEDFTRLLNS